MNIRAQLILNDVKHSREILQVKERQFDVLRTEIQSGDPVASGRVESKVVMFAPSLFVLTHRLPHPRQIFGHRINLLIIENDEFSPVLSYYSELQEGLVVSKG